MASGTPTFVELIWTAITARLDATDALASLPALTAIRRGTGDPSTELEQALGAAGKSGVAVMVSEPEVDIRSACGSGTGTFVVDIAESPALNRGPGGTRKTAQQLEPAIISSLLSWAHGLPIGQIYMRGPGTRPEEGGGMVRRITFAFSVIVTL